MAVPFLLRARLEDEAVIMSLPSSDGLTERPRSHFQWFKEHLSQLSYLLRFSKRNAIR